MNDERLDDLKSAVESVIRMLDGVPDEITVDKDFDDQPGEIIIFAKFADRTESYKLNGSKTSYICVDKSYVQ